jgi:hypothetical protein
VAAALIPAPERRRDVTDQVVAELREALAEEGFEAAWAEGRALSLDAAVALALEGTPMLAAADS